MDYSDFEDLYEKASAVEEEEPELAFAIHSLLIEEYVNLVKECYIGDRDYGVKYKIVSDGPGNYRSLLDYREKWVEAIAALSNHALGNLETIIAEKTK